MRGKKGKHERKKIPSNLTEYPVGRGRPVAPTDRK